MVYFVNKPLKKQSIKNANAAGRVTFNRFYEIVEESVNADLLGKFGLLLQYLITASEAMKRKVNLFLTPTFLILLLLFIFNDHVLKSLCPSFVTGKLSDFAGLFIFPVFLSIVMPRFASSKFSLMALHFFVGITFVIWKIAPIEVLSGAVQKLVSLPLPNRTKDATDLVALVSLPFSYKFLVRNLPLEVSPQICYARKFAAYAVFAIAGASILATSYASRYRVIPNLRSEQSEAEFLFVLEQTLAENAFEILDRKIDQEHRYIYKISLSYSFQDSVVANQRNNYSFYGELTVSSTGDSGQMTLESVNLHLINTKLDEKLVDEIVSKKLLEPLSRKIAK